MESYGFFVSGGLSVRCCAVQEAMRLYPVVPMGTVRQAPASGMQLGGHTIPPGAMLWVFFSAMFRSPHAWDAPDAFRPVRLPGPNLWMLAQGDVHPVMPRCQAAHVMEPASCRDGHAGRKCFIVGFLSTSHLFLMIKLTKGLQAQSRGRRKPQWSTCQEAHTSSPRIHAANILPLEGRSAGLMRTRSSTAQRTRRQPAQ